MQEIISFPITRSSATKCFSKCAFCITLEWCLCQKNMSFKWRFRLSWIYSWRSTRLNFGELEWRFRFSPQVPVVPPSLIDGSVIVDAVLEVILRRSSSALSDSRSFPGSPLQEEFRLKRTYRIPSTVEIYKWLPFCQRENRLLFVRYSTHHLWRW